MAKGDRGRGLPAGVQSLESFRRRNTHVHKMQSVPAPSLSSLAPPTSQGLFQDPREGFGDTAVEPFTLAPHPSHPQPLLPF